MILLIVLLYHKSRKRKSSLAVEQESGIRVNRAIIAQSIQENIMKYYIYRIILNVIGTRTIIPNTKESRKAITKPKVIIRTPINVHRHRLDVSISGRRINVPHSPPNLKTEYPIAMSAAKVRSAVTGTPHFTHKSSSSEKKE